MPRPPSSLRVVSFDLDGTLIHPAIFNAVAEDLGFGEPLRDTHRRYADGSLSLEDAFHEDVVHFVGRDVAEMRAALRASTRWTPGIPDAVELLKDAGHSVILTTDQPDFLAEHVLDFGFDAVVCSPGRCENGVVRGVDPRFEKWPNLYQHLARANVTPVEVAHVGNGENDIPVFERVGWSVAVFPSTTRVAAAARHVIREPSDLVEVARHLVDVD